MAFCPGGGDVGFCQHVGMGRRAPELGDALCAAVPKRRSRRVCVHGRGCCDEQRGRCRPHPHQTRFLEARPAGFPSFPYDRGVQQERLWASVPLRGPVEVWVCLLLDSTTRPHRYILAALACLFTPMCYGFDNACSFTPTLSAPTPFFSYHWHRARPVSQRLSPPSSPATLLRLMERL